MLDANKDREGFLANQSSEKQVHRIVAKSSKKSNKILLHSSLRRLLSVLTLMLMDTLALLLGLSLAGYLLIGEKRVEEIVYFAPILVAVWLAICAAHNLY